MYRRDNALLDTGSDGAPFCDNCRRYHFFRGVIPCIKIEPTKREPTTAKKREPETIDEI